MWELSRMLEISYNLSGDSYTKASYVTIVSLFILFVMPVVSLLTLFTEPRVGKVQAKGLEGDSGAIGTTAGLFSSGWHSSCSSILFWLTQQLQQQTHFILSSLGWPNGHSCGTAQWCLRIPTAYNRWPSEYLVTCMCSAINLSCYVVIIYKTWDEGAWIVHLG